MQIVIPTIVLTGIVFLYSKKKISVDLAAVLSDVASSSNCTVYPLDEEVVLRLPTNLDIHDAILVATGLLYRDLMEHTVAIISKDEIIKQANHLVDSDWITYLNCQLITSTPTVAEL